MSKCQLVACATYDLSMMFLSIRSCLFIGLFTRCEHLNVILELIRLFVMQFKKEMLEILKQAVVKIVVVGGVDDSLGVEL